MTQVSAEAAVPDEATRLSDYQAKMDALNATFADIKSGKKPVPDTFDEVLSGVVPTYASVSASIDFLEGQYKDFFNHGRAIVGAAREALNSKGAGLPALLSIEDDCAQWVQAEQGKLKV